MKITTYVFNQKQKTTLLACPECKTNNFIYKNEKKIQKNRKYSPDHIEFELECGDFLMIGQ